ncbi:MAG: hypothetical protein KH057_12895, partial [Bacteroides sp.]|nr:hypothetical protein [Bacteroides sp.]
PEAVLPASLCAKIMVFRRITRIIEVVLNERAVLLVYKNTEYFRLIEKTFYLCDALVQEIICF